MLSEGNPQYQMVDYGKLTPVLIKALQEQQDRIDKLEKAVRILLDQKKE